MTFTLPSYPSTRSDPHVLADFLELYCLEQGQASSRDIISFLERSDEGVVADDGIYEGVRDLEDEADEALDDVMIEIGRRREACHSYPFASIREGQAIEYRPASSSFGESVVYEYLLYCTRLNMKSHRVQAGLDGADLFEFLCAHVLSRYLGARSRAFVFGTGDKTTFPDRIHRLCRSLGEGGSFRSIDGDVSVYAKDDGVDVIGWIPFSDSTPGQLILFGQCKTGTHWKDSLTQCQPSDFCKRWLEYLPLVDPGRAYFVAESADRARWRSTCLSTGVLFDRCRIVDFAAGYDLAEIERWLAAAKSAHRILDN